MSNYSDSIFHSLLDDNSNQSSIADSSPVKQENSCSTSPTPEVTTVSHRENSEAKTDQSPDSKRGEKLLLTNGCIEYYQASRHWQPAGGIVAVTADHMDEWATSCCCFSSLTLSLSYKQPQKKNDYFPVAVKYTQRDTGQLWTCWDFNLPLILSLILSLAFLNMDLYKSV